MKRNFTKEQILQNAKEEDVKYIRLQFTDLLGVLKNVEIPVTKLEEALDNKIMFDGSSIEGFVRIQEADMFLYPDYTTWLVLRWENPKYGKVARLICDIYDANKKPFIGDPRYVLKKNIEEMNKLGFDAFNVGVEPEFFLFKLDDKGKPTLEFNDEGGYFDLSPIDSGEDCRRDIVLELQNIGFEISTAHHEVANGQHEINFKFDSALEACDNIQTFKLVVKNVAKRHNLHATFMPKPVRGINGSGMHTNCSLSKNGKNAFYDENDSLKLSKVARQFIGGVIKHAKGFTFITNPSINSYKRLVPGYEAPCYISWSDCNRSTMIRIPAAKGNATRCEIRSVDSSCNPYLAMSAILASGLDGIKNKIEVEPLKANLFEMTDEERTKLGVVNLPADLNEAKLSFLEDDVVKNSLNHHVIDKLLDAKSKEWDDYILTVHDWEIKKYL